MFHSTFVRFFLVTFVLNVFFGASSSSAWEFSMEGEVLWKNRFVGQLGSRGFFGKYDLDNSSTPGNYASVNGWASGKLNDLSSSSGAADQVMETNVLTDLRLNPAMMLRGEYRIGAFGDPVASSYTNSTSPGVQVAISEGQWTMWWFLSPNALGHRGLRKETFQIRMRTPVQRRRGSDFRIIATGCTDRSI